MINTVRKCHHIGDVDDALTLQQPVDTTAGSGTEWLAQQRPERLRHPLHCDGTEPISLANSQGTVRSAAQCVSLLQYRIKDRGEIAGRGIDNAEDLGGRSLLLQCLARLVDE